MPTAPTLAPLPNAEALTRHNIEIWRGMGYPDSFIANSMMEPRLTSAEEYKYWGLKWSRRNPPKRTPCTRQRRSKVTPEMALETINRAIETPGTFHNFRLVAELKIGASTLNRLRDENPDVDEAYQRLVAKNRGEANKHFRRRQKADRDLDRAEALLAKAIEEGRPINGAAICVELGRSRSWLALKVHEGKERAVALNEAIKDHNRKLQGEMR